MRNSTRVATVEGPLLARRNLIRYPGDPMRVSVKIGNNMYDMVLVRESAFDECDMSVFGMPTTYCILAPGLAAVWPTPAEDCVVNVMVEL